MIVVIVPKRNTNLYSTIKSLGDMIYGIPTQVILKDNATIGPKSSQVPVLIVTTLGLISRSVYTP
jgi:hypothetical protein